MLKYLAQIIKESFGEKGIIGRVGGDEFSVTVHDMEDNEINDMVSVMCDEMNNVKVNTLDGNILNMSCSVGVIKVKPNETFDEAMIRADKAMYSVKKISKNGFEIT